MAQAAVAQIDAAFAEQDRLKVLEVVFDAAEQRREMREVVRELLAGGGR